MNTAKPENLAITHGAENVRGLLESTLAVPWEANAKTWQFTYVGPQAVKLLGYPFPLLSPRYPDLAERP